MRCVVADSRAAHIRQMFRRLEQAQEHTHRVRVALRERSRSVAQYLGTDASREPSSSARTAPRARGLALRLRLRCWEISLRSP